MFRRQVAVASRHRYGLVSCQFLNLFDGRTRHRKPRAERVSIRVPDVAFNLRVL